MAYAMECREAVARAYDECGSSIEVAEQFACSESLHEAAPALQARQGPAHRNRKEYRSASFITNRSRTGVLASEPTSALAFHVTTRSIWFPMISSQSASA
jgi:hypothetical protein